MCGQCDVEQCGGNCTAHQGASTPVHGYHLSPNRDSSLNTNFCQYVTFHIDLTWHHCRRSCRCSGVKGIARKGRLDLRFASERCLEIACGTIATPTSARIVERVTGSPQVLSTRSFDPLSSWSSWSLQTRFSARGYLLVSTAPNNFELHTPNDPPGQQDCASTRLQFSSR
ncbi:uncharacterized protein TNCV_568141 [Trichonephila clavipes]|nr:uncharacterized protein TNCV_568141 [Trichonephila clavipes]